jgi:hypothetical protein
MFPFFSGLHHPQWGRHHSEARCGASARLRCVPCILIRGCTCLSKTYVCNVSILMSLSMSGACGLARPTNQQLNSYVDVECTAGSWKMKAQSSFQNLMP